MKKVLEDFTVIGHSRSFDETFFYFPNWRLALDLGKCPRVCLKADYLFLSHLHRDHAGGLWYFIATQSIQRSNNLPTIFVAEVYREKLLKALEALAALEERTYQFQIEFFQPPCQVSLKQDLELFFFPVEHTVPAFGCTLYKKERKLKPEFQGKRFQEIAELEQQGVEVTEEKAVSLVSYLGDTTPKGLDENPHVFESKYLFLECTFLTEEHRELARKTGHIHFQDIVERKERFQNEQIFLTHFSLRYSEEEIRFFLNTSLPEELFERVSPWLPS